MARAGDGGSEGREPTGWGDGRAAGAEGRRQDRGSGASASGDSSLGAKASSKPYRSSSSRHPQSSSTEALRARRPSEAAEDPLERAVDALRSFARKPYSREAFVGGLLGAGFAVMVGRLAYLQGFAAGDLYTDAKVERTARRVLPHRRGGIYDRDGNVLARSVDAVDIAAHPNLIHDVNATANLVAGVLGGDAASYAEKLSRTGEDGERVTYVYLVRNADASAEDLLRSELARINKDRKAAGLEELGGFEYESTSRRVYPQGAVAGNVVGLVGTDGHGLTGLELEYDDVLSGTDGYLIQERGVYGDPVVGGQYERVEPVDGENIVISIDLDIQRAAQEQLSKIIADWSAGDGCAIVTNPRTGEIYACCSTPYLDLSDTSTAETAAFNLRCVSDSYEPGSTVKPLTASMAIDLGVATPYTDYYVPARVQVGDDMVGDSDSRSYDTDMTLTNILERSSNVGAVLCAEMIGASQFAAYLERYRIGHPTGIDYPGEAYGIVPKLEDYTGAWESLAFGQGLAVPPVQVARAIGAIANGGVLTTPHFLVNKGGEDVAYEEGGQAVSAATASQVAEMMYSVVENGYGSTGAVEGYRVSAKTGTAERAAEGGGYLQGLYTVSFIGFAPTDDPQVLVYVLVDYLPDATGSEAVGAPWAVIMQAALSKLQIPPSG